MFQFVLHVYVVVKKTKRFYLFDIFKINIHMLFSKTFKKHKFALTCYGIAPKIRFYKYFW